MIGVSIKASITCPDCESSVPLNALIPSIECPSCGAVLDLSVDVWKTVLDDAIEEAPFTEEGMGSSTSVFGSYNYSMVRGRLQPRYQGTKEEIEDDIILAGLKNSYVTHPESGEKTSVRELPPLYRNEFAGVVALIGEESSLIPGENMEDAIEVTNSSHPVAFACPQCGGNLMVSGEQRLETCKYCETRVYLPDDLWRILHPIKTKRTWYLLCDFSKKPFSWESDVESAVFLGDDKFCVVVENDYGDHPIIACLNRDKTPIWTRDDIDLLCDTEDSPPGLMRTPHGNLLAMDKNGKDLLNISGEDGSVIRSINEQSKAAEGLPHFTMDECSGITCLPNGDIVMLRYQRQGVDSRSILLRFDCNGNPLPLWKKDQAEEEKKTGFWERLAEKFSSVQLIGANYIEDFGNYQEKVKESALELGTGSDGSVYMLRYKRLAAFDPSGKKRYVIEIPCSTVFGRPVANNKGEAFVISHSNQDSTQILRISADGQTISVVAESGEDEEEWDNLRTLVLEPDGTLHVFGYGGTWITLKPSSQLNGKVLAANAVN